VSNVAFVLATDSAQLRHSIKAVYGGTFDSAAYLRRFFDRTYRFEPPKVAAFVADQASRHGIQADIFELPEQNDLQKFLVDGVEFFDLSLRDIEQCFDLLSTVAAVWSSGHKIQIAYLFPLVVAFQQSDDNLFDLLLHRDSARLSQYWRSRRPSWTITLFESDGYRKRPVAVDFLTYISELLGQLSIALPDLAGRDASSHISRTVFQMYMQEYQVLHHGVHYSGNPKPTSVLRSYPELVRNAGRITLPV
jgi:hypothetical protein